MIEESTRKGLDSVIECEHGSSFELFINVTYLVRTKFWTLILFFFSSYTFE